MGVCYDFTMPNYTHRVIRSISSGADSLTPVGTLIDGTLIPRENLMALESSEHLIALTPDEIAALSAPVVESEPVVAKPVAKKAPAKKAPVKKSGTATAKKPATK